MLVWGGAGLGMGLEARTGPVSDVPACDTEGSGSRQSHLLQVFIEEIENRVRACQLPPLLHVLVPRPIRHWGREWDTDTPCQLQLCPQLQPPPCCRLRFTFPLHEVLQEAVPGAWIRVHLGHVVEVIIGDGHVLCISGNVDHLQGADSP